MVSGIVRAVVGGLGLIAGATVPFEVVCVMTHIWPVVVPRKKGECFGFCSVSGSW